jgi:hypothetical protein
VFVLHSSCSCLCLLLCSINTSKSVDAKLLSVSMVSEMVPTHLVTFNCFLNYYQYLRVGVCVTNLSCRVWYQYFLILMTIILFWLLLFRCAYEYRYNEFDQPVCRVCEVVLKSESLWDAHQVSRKHREVIIFTISFMSSIWFVHVYIVLL